MKKDKGPRILVLDIETAPLLVHCWGLFDQNIGLNQVKSDWHILSFSAKWYRDAKGKIFGPHNRIMYKDQRNAKNIEDDSTLLKEVWELLDQCDILLTQNGIKFDNKKLNSRFVLSGMKPPSSFKHIDTLQIAKKYFSFTSNKLEYMSDKLNVKFKKQTKRKFAGFDLWKECLDGNKEAWKEMRHYNEYDILALEELYHKLSPWDNSIDFNIYSDELTNNCKCGSENLIKRGFFYSPVGKFQRYKCGDCGAETRSRKNLLDKEKKETVKTATVRNSS
jgi:DNA polymerase III epsilon subunit-like protein